MGIIFLNFDNDQHNNQRIMRLCVIGKIVMDNKISPFGRNSKNSICDTVSMPLELKIWMKRRNRSLALLS
jgi:hypothetical protein